MLLLIYNLILSPLYLLGLPYFFYRWLTGDHVEWRQRSGFFRDRELPPAQSIWIHVASMGEVVAAAPLVSEIIKTASERPIFFTTMTRTGQKRARDLLPPEVTIAFLPFDVIWIIKSLLKKVNPAILVLVETELWFNLISQAKKAGVAVYVVNGRLSEKSFKQYRRLRGGLSDVLSQIDGCFVQNDRYGSRFEVLGVQPKRIRVSGNTKYDSLLNLPRVNSDLLRQSLGLESSEFVIVAGCTRPGEEAILIPVIKEFPDIRWIIAPRHLNRISNIENLLNRGKISWSYYDSGPTRSQLILLNTMGKLTEIYSLANIAFVGGSLTDFGGHNLFEPAAWGVPVIFGPYTRNCKEQAEDLTQQNGGWQVENAESFISILKKLDSSGKIVQIGQNAKQAVEKRAGVSRQIVKEILPK